MRSCVRPLSQDGSTDVAGRLWRANTHINGPRPGLHSGLRENGYLVQREFDVCIKVTDGNTKVHTMI